MASIADIEEEKRQYQEQLDIVAGQIRDDPENAELSILQNELNNLIQMLDENLAELKPEVPQAAPKQPSPPPAQPEKWSRDSHPAFKKDAAQTEEKEDAPVNYQVNDTVMAKWTSGDKAFYPARITSITGSSTAPIYIVKFKSYDNTETLKSKDIRPISNKRKAEPPGAAPSPSIATPPAPGVVSSAGATVYPEAKRDNENNEDGSKPPKPKKIRAKKELEAGKSKWQEFNSKTKSGKKVSKKESMFRTPDGVHGRVGFTGSGQAMRKDPTRSRHVYQVNEELD